MNTSANGLKGTAASLIPISVTIQNPAHARPKPCKRSKLEAPGIVTWHQAAGEYRNSKSEGETLQTPQWEKSALDAEFPSPCNRH